jgi:hypothetical protein
MKLIQNRKGNAVALVLVAVIVLGGMVAYNTHFNNPISDAKSQQSNVVTQAEIALDEGISQGISEFMLSGYSDKNKVWYCNYPYPPYLEESNGSLHTIVEGRVEGYIDSIREQGFSIESPDINFDIISMDIGDLDNDSITAFIDNYLVGIETDELVEKQDLSGSITKDWRVWLMFRNLLDWTEGNAGDITGEIYNKVFRGKACQAVAASF